jgi:hypothetical protein
MMTSNTIMTRRFRVPAATRAVVLVFGMSLGPLGCKNLTGDQDYPAGTVDPATYNTPAGARGMRTAALYALAQEMPLFITNTGLLTDELVSNTIGTSPGAILVSPLPPEGVLDARILPAPSYGQSGTAAGGDYNKLQVVRADIAQAVAALAAYDTSASTPFLRGELFALEGYTEILLADFFCSGVPLSTLDFHGDYTYHAGSTTEDVYHDALVQLDSALALADTNTQVRNLARVLRGRALLALGQYAAAATAVSTVPDGFTYQLGIQWQRGDNADTWLNFVGTVADREGTVGLPYRSSLDPRTMTVNTFSNQFDVQLTFPVRYNTEGFSPFVVADWIEARLIQAEAAYHAGNSAGMITLLNQLRATAMVPGQTIPVTGTLTDPGTDSARVALLFQERAYWLFLTGHRQGDLRRLLRQYSEWFEQSDQVYPVGPYPGQGTVEYGADVTAPIPGQEYINPLFRGCLNRAP